MYLFQQQCNNTPVPDAVIYIPLCIYFNSLPVSCLTDTKLFTFHYVSISTTVIAGNRFKDFHLHSTMYLFQQLWQHTYTKATFYLHSTMYLFQLTPILGLAFLSSVIYIPLCIYFNLSPSSLGRQLNVFTFHYVSISTLTIFLSSSLYPIFTFHYVSISTKSPITSEISPYEFTFHYVSISTCPQWLRLQPGSYLHSTMYLFQLFSWIIRIRFIIIYIPLCIYFNFVCQLSHLHIFPIYIPLCIYFNLQRWHYDIQFTFIYIPLCIYFNNRLPA